MNYTLITNHAHAHTHPSSPLGEPESKKIDFIAPIFASSEISKSINVYVIQTWYNQCHNKIKILNKMVHLKYPILEIC